MSWKSTEASCTRNSSAERMRGSEGKGGRVKGREGGGGRVRGEMEEERGYSSEKREVVNLASSPGSPPFTVSIIDGL